jgi:hypothetical protein
MKTSSFQQTQRISRTIMGLLSLLALGDIVNFILTFCDVYFPYMIPVEGGEPVSIWMAFMGFVGLVQFPLSVITAVCFLMWVYRSYKNLKPLGAAETDFSPGWVIGFWFIPFANLVLPFMNMREIWNKSDPGGYGRGAARGEGVTLGSLGTWWALWLIANLMANVSVYMQISDPNKDLALSATAFSAIAFFFSVLAAIAAINVVKSVTERQKLRYERMFSGGVSDQGVEPD